MTLTIEQRGFDEAIAYFEDIDVPGRLAIAVDKTIEMLGRLAASVTPVDTGAMRKAWRWVKGRLFIDPGARNPRSGVPVTDYATTVSERYGILDAVMTQAGRVGAAALEEAFSGI